MKQNNTADPLAQDPYRREGMGLETLYSSGDTTLLYSAIHVHESKNSRQRPNH
ncbi:MAG: hypothetical protein U5R49_08200 [Deltaproteobacteria bacterium]|nr:hypothetical protein [Deltaproteobacteria bacterium]